MCWFSSINFSLDCCHHLKVCSVFFCDVIFPIENLVSNNSMNSFHVWSNLENEIIYHSNLPFVVPNSNNFFFLKIVFHQKCLRWGFFRRNLYGWIFRNPKSAYSNVFLKIQTEISPEFQKENENFFSNSIFDTGSYIGNFLDRIS